MALYHLTAKTGTRATGASALAKAQYIQREAHYARVPDAVVYATSHNLPSFADGSATAFWDAADLYERANGRLFKEVEFALPVELPPAEQRQLAESFAEELLAGERLPYTLAIHAGKGHNPHCHVLVSERVNDDIPRPADQWFRRWNEDSPEDGGARKSRALHPRAWLEAIRERWAELVNLALERAGFRERVDHRSLEAQGAEREPQIHLGPNVSRMKQRGLGSERAEEAERIAERNRSLTERRVELETPDAGDVQRDIDVGDSDPSSIGRDESVNSEGPLPDTASASPAGTDLVGIALPAPDRSPLNRSVSAPPPSESDLSPDELGSLSGREAERSAGPPASECSQTRYSEELSPKDGERGVDHPQNETIAPHERSLSRAVPHPGRDPSDEDLPSADREPRGRREPTTIDRTARAVSRQLEAMDCDSFDIGIREATTGRMMNRTWSRDEVLEHLSWLKHMNARGNDIFVRPADREHGLVLVDDLSRSGLAALERDQCTPALVVETSPENYQAWVRVPEPTLDAERGAIARHLAREYGGDLGSASERHFGRLAGFTNRKAVHRSPKGLPPFALLRESRGWTAPEGPALLRDANLALEERSPAAESPNFGEDLAPPSRPTPETEREATEFCRDYLEELQRRMNDLSRCDFSAAVRLAERGFGAETMREALRATSPRLEERKRGHIDDYLERTVDVALRSARQRARERERDGTDGMER